MGKPFKLQEAGVGFGRGPDGKFTKIAAPSPEEVFAGDLSSGQTLPQRMRATAVPMQEVGKGAPVNVAGPGTPVYPAANPWPPAGPATDAGRKPFRFR